MSEIAYQGDVQQVCTVARLEEPGPYHRIWQPFLTTDVQGNLVYVYGTQLNGKTDMADLWCRSSHDGGTTWSEPTPVLNHQQFVGPVALGYANPVLYRDPACETIWCVAMRAPLYLPDTEHSQLCASVTADGGISWRTIELAVLYACFPITCAGIQRVADDRGHRYLLPVHRRSRADTPRAGRDQLVLESRDLLTWRRAGAVPYDPTQPAFLHEGGLATGDDGALVIAMRTAALDRSPAPHPTLRAYTSTSHDDGHTWSPAQPDPALYNSVAKASSAMTYGLMIYVYNDGPGLGTPRAVVCHAPARQRVGEPRRAASSTRAMVASWPCGTAPTCQAATARRSALARSMWQITTADVHALELARRRAAELNMCFRTESRPASPRQSACRATRRVKSPHLMAQYA